MAASPANPDQALVTAWVVQMIGTIVIAGVVIWFFRAMGPMFDAGNTRWPLYALYAGVAAIIPSVLYLRNFKHVLDTDRQAAQANGGQPHPAIRPVLLRALAIGMALCDLPQAFGVVHVMLGGETRWFYGATLVTIALKLAYRPFERLRR